MPLPNGKIVNGNVTVYNPPLQRGCRLIIRVERIVPNYAKMSREELAAHVAILEAQVKRQEESRAGIAARNRYVDDKASEVCGDWYVSRDWRNVLSADSGKKVVYA